MALHNVNESSNINNRTGFSELPNVTTYDLYGRARRLLNDPHDVTVMIIGLIAIVMNVLILSALRKAQPRLRAHIQLIISLAVSDVLVGASVTLFIINKSFNPVYNQGGLAYIYERIVSRCLLLVLKALNSTGFLSTLFNLMLMAADHYLAILTPLKHTVIMRKEVVTILISFLWGMSIVIGFSDFLSAVPLYHTLKPQGYNYCECVSLTRYREDYTTIAIAPVCFIVMSCMYCRIYSKIRYHRKPGCNLSTSRHNSIKKTTKALVTTLLALGTFLVTWLPFNLLQVSLLIMARFNRQKVLDNLSFYMALDSYLFDLMMLNAVADSIIYAIRNKDVKLGLYQIFSCFEYCRNKLRSLQQERSETVRLTLRRSTSSAVCSKLSLIENVTVLAATQNFQKNNYA